MAEIEWRNSQCGRFQSAGILSKAVRTGAMPGNPQPLTDFHGIGFWN
jgi:hypothetical protein